MRGARCETLDEGCWKQGQGAGNYVHIARFSPQSSLYEILYIGCELLNVGREVQGHRMLYLGCAAQGARCCIKGARCRE
jgi:hypothetical protein